MVLIPLEDGDRCEALVAMGKKVIAIDLNPLSRTARKATVSIVDNIMRAVPQLTEQVIKLSARPRAELEDVMREYDNERVLRAAVRGDTGASGGADSRRNQRMIVFKLACYERRMSLHRRANLSKSEQS